MRRNNYYDTWSKMYLRPLKTAYQPGTAEKALAVIDFLWEVSMVGRDHRNFAHEEIARLRKESTGRDWFESAHTD
jgi:hypothetical protein